jgi:hypothetical protein
MGKVSYKAQMACHKLDLFLIKEELKTNLKNSQ